MKSKISDFKLDFELPDNFERAYIRKDICTNMFEVRYSYRTKRGNPKENIRYIAANDCEEARCDFMNYINEFSSNQTVFLSNVKILDVKCIGRVNLLEKDKL